MTCLQYILQSIFIFPSRFLPHTPSYLSNPVQSQWSSLLPNSGESRQSCASSNIHGLPILPMPERTFTKKPYRVWRSHYPPSRSPPVQAPEWESLTQQQGHIPQLESSSVSWNAHQSQKVPLPEIESGVPVVFGECFPRRFTLMPLPWFSHWWEHCIGRFEWLTPVSWRAWHTPADRCRLAVWAGLLPWPAGSLQMNSLWWVPPGL